MRQPPKPEECVIDQLWQRRSPSQTRLRPPTAAGLRMKVADSKPLHVWKHLPILETDVVFNGLSGLRETQLDQPSLRDQQHHQESAWTQPNLGAENQAGAIRQQEEQFTRNQPVKHHQPLSESSPLLNLCLVLVLTQQN